MEELKPKEYENVLVFDNEGKPIIAHRNGTRWYGYTLLEWLAFEPTGFLPLNDISSLRTELEQVKIERDVATEVVENIQGKVAMYAGKYEMEKKAREKAEAELARRDEVIGALEGMVAALNRGFNLCEVSKEDIAAVIAARTHLAEVWGEPCPK